MDYKFTSKDEMDTLSLAQNIESEKFPNMIICLNGELGTGKTVFVKGFAQALGIDETITSPTFTIVNEYIKNDIKIYHFDVYRLVDSSEFYAIGGEEYFENGICIIEWGEIIEDALPNTYIHIKFDQNFDNENFRTLHIFSNGEKYDSLLDEFIL